MKQNVISLSRLPDIVNREYTGMRIDYTNIDV